MMRSHSLSGVLYAEDFDAPEPVAAAPAAAAVRAETRAEPVVIEPTFSLTELQLATERARQEERMATRQQAEQDAAALRTQALVQLADAVAQARTEAARIAAEAAEATAHTLLAAVAARLPTLSAAHGEAEAAALLRLLLPAMANEPRLTVRAHPALAASLRQETKALLEDGGTVVEWIVSETMSPGDVVVRWQDGFMIRDTNALCAEVRALLVLETRSDTRQETAHAD